MGVAGAKMFWWIWKTAKKNDGLLLQHSWSWWIAWIYNWIVHEHGYVNNVFHFICVNLNHNCFLRILCFGTWEKNFDFKWFFDEKLENGHKFVGFYHSFSFFVCAFPYFISMIRTGFKIVLFRTCLLAGN